VAAPRLRRLARGFALIAIEWLHFASLRSAEEFGHYRIRGWMQMLARLPRTLDNVSAGTIADSARVFNRIAG